MWIAVAVSAPLLLAAVRRLRWWTGIAPEQTPMTWMHSVVLVVAGVAAVLAGNVRGSERPRRYPVLRRLQTLLARLIGTCPHVPNPLPATRAGRGS
jgi:hypothetical protein